MILQVLLVVHQQPCLLWAHLQPWYWSFDSFSIRASPPSKPPSKWKHERHLAGKLVPGNLHMNMMVSGALEILAYTVAIFAFLKWASFLPWIFLIPPIVDWVAVSLSPCSWPLLEWLSSWHRQLTIKPQRWEILFNDLFLVCRGSR